MLSQDGNTIHTTSQGIIYRTTFFSVLKQNFQLLGRVLKNMISAVTEQKISLPRPGLFRLLGNTKQNKD